MKDEEIKALVEHVVEVMKAPQQSLEKWLVDRIEVTKIRVCHFEEQDMHATANFDSGMLLAFEQVLEKLRNHSTNT